MLCHLKEEALSTRQLPVKHGLRTFHDHLHIVYKAMYNTERLCDGYPGLILGQSIQPLKYSLNLALS